MTRLAIAAALTASTAALAAGAGGRALLRSAQGDQQPCHVAGPLCPAHRQAARSNYRETTLPLPGWLNCALYGATTYTCDYPELKTAQDAVQAQARIAKDILACFAGTWAEAPEQSSGDFLVLHPKLGPASITLNLDQTEKGHLVRLIMFLRRG
jgi:hypothetical protein